MRDRKLFYWSSGGVIAIFGLAGVWHYGYVWFPCNFTAVLFPVNESPWEHVKIFLIPAIIVYTVIYFVEGKKYRNFLSGHSLGLLVTPAVMLGLYYLYTGLLNVSHCLLLDIIICFISILTGSAVAFFISRIKKDLGALNIYGLLIPLMLMLIYAIFTFYPPELMLFFDKSINRFGIVEPGLYK